MEKMFDAVQNFLEEYGYENKLTKAELDETVSLKVFPVGDKMVFGLLIRDGVEIGSVMDFGDHMIITNYYEGEHGECKDNRH